MIAGTLNATSSATPSISASGAVGRGGWRREDGFRGYRTGACLLHRDRQAADTHSARGAGACRQPAPSGVVEGNAAPGGRGDSRRRRCRYDDQCRAGLRWALIGPHLTFHLAGRVGGIDHFLDQFATPMANFWESLGNPMLTSELKQRLTAGITAETAGRGVAELAAWRDDFLVDLLALRSGRK